MPRRLVLPIAATFVLAGAAPLPAQSTFEGVIVSVMSGGDHSMEMTTRYKGGMARMEMPMGPGGGAYQLIDMGKGTMTAVMPEQKMYMTMDFAGMAGSVKDQTTGDAEVKITATGKTETIAGHRCDHYLIESEGHQMDVCAAKGLGYLGMMGGSNPMGARGGPAAASIPVKYRELYAKFKDGFQPLKVEQVKGEKRTVILEVKSIEAKPQDEALFKVPTGYRDMSAMMKGKMPSMPKPRG